MAVINSNSTMQGDRLLSTAQGCVYINVHKKTLLRYARAGLISYVRYRGKLQFRKSALDYFISKNEVKV